MPNLSVMLQYTVESVDFKAQLLMLYNIWTSKATPNRLIFKANKCVLRLKYSVKREWSVSWWRKRAVASLSQSLTSRLCNKATNKGVCCPIYQQLRTWHIWKKSRRKSKGQCAFPTVWCETLVHCATLLRQCQSFYTNPMPSRHWVQS